MNGTVATSVESAYPSGRLARDRFVLSRRGSRPSLDPFTHQGLVIEPERSADGLVVSTATLFLTGRECPWRCVMCDLWRHTTVGDTPRGAIPRQIADAVVALRASPAMPALIKLYNAGSFFDARAVPPADDDRIARALEPFARVVVESHPSLVGDRTWRLRDALGRSGRDVRLEVAMGLETAHPVALEHLNKGITVEAFAAAARTLASHDVDLRVFLLIDPPFVAAADQHTWLARSVAAAFECGASVVSLIPTRTGNGAMDTIEANGDFAPPDLFAIEEAAAVGLACAKGRLFVDTWDLDRFSACDACARPRRDRLTDLNLTQQVPPSLSCPVCGEVTPS